jgi:hypothetical protein
MNEIENSDRNPMKSKHDEPKSADVYNNLDAQKQT